MVGEARARVGDWLEGAEPLPLERSPEESADIIAAIANGRSTRAIVNLPNRGQIDNLPHEAVVETLAEVGAAGAQPLNVGSLPPGVLNTVHPHAVNQEMIVDAALHGDRQLALQALINDPLVRDYRSAPRMLEELLRAHTRYLPQF
jgi:alpha-galactosidase/6-phospho-beta-glucosidase family protein